MPNRHATLASRTALAAIAAAWLASLALPAVAVAGGPTLTGFDLLTEAWKGAARGVLAWYANPSFLAALVAAALGRLRAARIAAGIGAALGLTSFAAEAVLRLRMESVPDLVFRAGFHLWLCALIALFLWSWLAVHFQQRNNLQRL